MASPYHPGELAVQERARVLAEARRVGEIIDTGIPPRAEAFLAGQRLAVVGTTDGRGRVWASLLTGEAGMLRVTGSRLLRIASSPAAGDPLAETLAAAGERGTPTDAGVLAIDFATRRRLRVNGVAEPASDGGVLLHVRQAYWICPKYIQARLIRQDPAERPPARLPRVSARPRTSALTDAQRDLVARADTFFIASAHPRAGADASHRGGAPGFVQLARDASGRDVLEFPDYPGNNMFNTFGNLAVSPAAGLLFVDFDMGATLQLTGAAEVLWEPAQFARWPGAQRAVRFSVVEALELPRGSALRWHLIQASPYNPPPPAAAIVTE